MDAERVRLRDEMEIAQRALGATYRLVRVLSVGGTSRVYLANENTSGRQLAVKILRREYVRLVIAQRFLREIDFASQLHHEHIVKLIDANQVGDVIFYVMPFIAGESLADRIHREGRLDIDDVVSTASQVAAALAYAHSKDIVHRDIKPANILMRDKHAFVTDFGVALALYKAEAERITSSGLFVGTPVYMSPEQSGALDHIDGRSDVYALGCVMYEMLTGEPVFDGPDAQVIVARHRYQRVPSVRARREGVPAALEDVVNLCLAKSPDDRFATAWDLVDALDDIADQVSGVVSASTKHPPEMWPRLLL